MFRTLISLAMILIAVAHAAGAAAMRPATRPSIVAAAMMLMPADLRQRAEPMIERAMGEDRDDSLAALMQLRELGPSARPALRNVASHVLERDAVAVAGALAALPERHSLAQREAELMGARAAAMENLQKLARDQTVETARENHEKLKQLHAGLANEYARKATLISAMTLRAELLDLFRSVFGKVDEPAEAELQWRVHEALGAAPREVDGQALLTARTDRKWLADHPFHHYLACRQIELFNRGLDALMGREELRNARLVNEYRELLGLLPLEYHPSLVQAARRHSKEMSDLNYHGHESPTASERTPAMRVRNAGYRGIGSGENCAVGYSDGARVFWGWFNSPAHHRILATPAVEAFGVGRWNSAWTQNFGFGPRRMFLADADQREAQVRGEILAPQDEKEIKPPHRRTTTTTEVRIYAPGRRTWHERREQTREER